jgi:hypothetical protein
MLLHLGRLLENNGFIVAINGWSVSAAALEIIHYFSMFLIVGPTVMVDLRVLGVADRHHPVAELAERFFPWVWVALAFNVLSGFVMFAGDAVAYIRESTFHAKLLVVLLAVLFTLVVHWNVSKWDRLPSTPFTAKTLAFLSLLFWIGAILAGVEVPALSGIG